MLPLAEKNNSSLKPILAVDDNEDSLYTLEELLRGEGYSVITATDGEEALRKARQVTPAGILLDLNMPRLDGLALTKRLQSHPTLRFVPVIFVTASDRDTDLIHGLDLGAHDYVTKPYKPSVLLARLRAALRTRRAVEEIHSRRTRKYSTGEETMEGLAPIIGQSLAARRLRELIAQLAPETAPVLISGETGTGKELCARHLHAASARKEQPFVARNCAAFPETLAESELFGHTRGAFTGALRDRKGVFELAHGGTLFLDEIGELSLTLQAKLLRVLQEGVVTPVGSTLDRKVDVRLIAATNRNLREMVRAGQFREDLWYRLNVLHIHIPSLSNRQEDIPLLIQVILEEQGRRRGRTYEIDQSAKRMLCSYPWPGNIRELRNELQRLVILAGERNAPLGPELLSPHIVEAVDTNLSSDGMSGSLRTARERFERTIIEHTLREVGWNKSAAAKRLGMSRTTLIAKAQRYGLTKSFAETRRKR